MEVVVFVPGIMGTRLHTPEGEEVWPPTPREVLLGYGRIDKLMRDDLVEGEIIDTVSCFGFYKSLINQLKDIGYNEDGASKRLELFPYDWRRDLEFTASKLADTLSRLVTNGATSLIIVAHSMGGLISRLVLESDKYQSKGWFQKIKFFLALATPHLGAPLALARVLGMDSTLGISTTDFRTFAADSRYPSGYQLLPAPGEAACWDITNNELNPLNIYDTRVAQALGLDSNLLKRTRFVHDTLANGSQPSHVRYFYFAGAGHETVTRINIASNSRHITRSDDAGDGTVPLWSALPKPGQKQVVVGEHADFFRKENFKAIFYPLLGREYDLEPFCATESFELSVHSFDLNINDTIELLLIPSSPTRKIAGTLFLERTDDADKPFDSFRDPLDVFYEGPKTPQLKLVLDPTGQEGFYRVRFSGELGGSDDVHFMVSKQSQ